MKKINFAFICFLTMIYGLVGLFIGWIFDQSLLHSFIVGGTLFLITFLIMWQVAYSEFERCLYQESDEFDMWIYKTIVLEGNPQFIKEGRVQNDAIINNLCLFLLFGICVVITVTLGFFVGLLFAKKIDILAEHGEPLFRPYKKWPRIFGRQVYPAVVIAASFMVFLIQKLWLWLQSVLSVDAIKNFTTEIAEIASREVIFTVGSITMLLTITLSVVLLLFFRKVFRKGRYPMWLISMKKQLWTSGDS